jgi:hypothetical protein
MAAPAPLAAEIQAAATAKAEKAVSAEAVMNVRETGPGVKIFRSGGTSDAENIQN